MNRLLEIGFQPSGHWLLENNELTVVLTRHSKQKNILYAFVCDGQVKYVGKTTQSLEKRMASYRRPGATQSTNIRNNFKIRELLAEGCAVEVLALPDNGLMHFGQFHINMAAGLEDDIIRTVKPEWNGEKSFKSPEIDTELELIESPAPQPMSGIGAFTFILQPTYARTGFFNVGVSASDLIGGDGDIIEIYCGESETPIVASINRRANVNSTPRIMGGVGLRAWFGTMRVGEIVCVDVESRNSIRLQKSLST